MAASTKRLADQNVLMMDVPAVPFIKFMKLQASLKNAPEGLKKDWNIIEKWLGCKNRELDNSDHDKIRIAWKSYTAICNPPSLKLKNSFVNSSKTANQENWDLLPLPIEVKNVFDRMLATDNEIKTMRNLKTARAVAALGEQNERSAKKIKVSSWEITQFSIKKRSILSIFLAVSIFAIAYTTDFWHWSEREDPVVFTAIPILFVYFFLKFSLIETLLYKEKEGWKRLSLIFLFAGGIAGYVFWSNSTNFYTRYHSWEHSPATGILSISIGMLLTLFLIKFVRNIYLYVIEGFKMDKGGS